MANIQRAAESASRMLNPDKTHDQFLHKGMRGRAEIIVHCNEPSGQQQIICSAHHLHQAIQQKRAWLKVGLEQLDVECMRLAVLLMRQGKVADITKGHKGCTFGQASRQLAMFQVEV